MFTITNIIIFATLFALCILFSLAFGCGTEDAKCGLGCFAVTTVILIFIIIGTAIYNTNTASGKRALKDTTSELQNGINREITITAEDGREIFHYEGKVDIESNHEDNYIKFDSEEGKRYIVYYGIQDTITIIEK